MSSKLFYSITTTWDLRQGTSIIKYYLTLPGLRPVSTVNWKDGNCCQHLTPVPPLSFLFSAALLKGWNKLCQTLALQEHLLTCHRVPWPGASFGGHFEAEQFLLPSFLLPLYGLCRRWSVVAASPDIPLQGFNFTAVCDQWEVPPTITWRGLIAAKVSGESVAFGNLLAQGRCR